MTTRMKYTGDNQATFSGAKRAYKVGPGNRFADVESGDVDTLLSSGSWEVKPYNVPGLRYLTDKEINLLREVARTLPENPVVVNIGAGSGTSATTFLESREDLFLYTVDKQKEHHPTGSLAAELENLIRFGVYDPARFTQVHGDSAKVGREWSEQLEGQSKVDMVFVDGGHSYEECKADIEAWLPHVKPRGIIAFHDCEPTPKVWDGVYKAVNELMSQYVKLSHADNLAVYLVVINQT